MAEDFQKRENEPVQKESQEAEVISSEDDPEVMDPHDEGAPDERYSDDVAEEYFFGEDEEDEEPRRGFNFLLFLAMVVLGAITARACKGF